jgi:anti-anti-sigma regulatory factor
VCSGIERHIGRRGTTAWTDMNHSRRDGILNVDLTEADLNDPVMLHSIFEDFIFNDGDRRIALDLSAITMLTSLMIGTLVSLHLLAYENVVVLTFQGLHEKILSLFRLIGVDKLIEAHYSALGSDGRQHPNA